MAKACFFSFLLVMQNWGKFYAISCCYARIIACNDAVLLQQIHLWKFQYGRNVWAGSVGVRASFFCLFASTVARLLHAHKTLWLCLKLTRRPDDLSIYYAGEWKDNEPDGHGVLL